MPKFIVEISLDEEYSSDEEEIIATEEFIYEQLSFAGSCVTVERYIENE